MTRKIVKRSIFFPPPPPPFLNPTPTPSYHTQSCRSKVVIPVTDDTQKIVLRSLFFLTLPCTPSRPTPVIILDRAGRRVHWTAINARLNFGPLSRSFRDWTCNSCIVRRKPSNWALSVHCFRLRRVHDDNAAYHSQAQMFALPIVWKKMNVFSRRVSIIFSVSFQVYKFYYESSLNLLSTEDSNINASCFLPKTRQYKCTLLSTEDRTTFWRDCT